MDGCGVRAGHLSFRPGSSGRARTTPVHTVCLLEEDVDNHALISCGMWGIQEDRVKAPEREGRGKKAARGKARQAEDSGREVWEGGVLLVRSGHVGSTAGFNPTVVSKMMQCSYSSSPAAPQHPSHARRRVGHGNTQTPGSHESLPPTPASSRLSPPSWLSSPHSSAPPPTPVCPAHHLQGPALACQPTGLALPSLYPCGRLNTGLWEQTAGSRPPREEPLWVSPFMGTWKGQGSGGGCSERSMSVQCLEGLRKLPSGCVLTLTGLSLFPLHRAWSCHWWCKLGL